MTFKGWKNEGTRFERHSVGHSASDSELVHLGESIAFIQLSRPDPTRKTKPGINARYVWPRQAVYFTLIWFWYSRTPFVSAAPPIRPL